MTRGYPGDLQTFYPEIDRTFHRLVRHSVHLDHSVHFEHSEHSEHYVYSEHSVAGDSEHFDFEHSATNFHTENMAQPPPCERTVATYPFAGERGKVHGCVFHRRKMRGVATNVY